MTISTSTRLAGLALLAITVSPVQAAPATDVSVHRPSRPPVRAGLDGATPHQPADIVVSGRPRQPRHVPRETIDGAYNVVGFAGAAPNEGGTFSIGDAGLSLSHGSARRLISLNAVRSFAFEHGNKGLLRGTKGMIASFAPQGIGQVYSLFRPGARMLTIFYADEDQGLHGAVLMVPEAGAEGVARALTAAGVAPFERTSLAQGEEPVNTATVRPNPAGIPGGGDLQVQVPATAVAEMPVAYLATTYEALIEQLGRRPSAYRIFRQGDLRADPQGLTMSTSIVAFRKGNAGLRGAVPIVGSLAGKTSIAADATLTDPAGRTLLAIRSKGARMLPGESFGATIGLAKQIGGKLARAGGRADTGDEEVASR